MTLFAPSPSSACTVDLEDPRSPDSATLLAGSEAFIAEVYPEDEDDACPSPMGDGIARDGSFAVARVDGAAAGCGALMPLADPGAREIVRMFVRPEFRGRRIADAVLAALEARARALGARTILLRCGPRQPVALCVYRRNGYVERGPFGRHTEHDLNIFLEKTIA
ncbi:MAG: GNAT family N-acetyltransferase [Hyphomonadaceae bacterium]